MKCLLLLFVLLFTSPIWAQDNTNYKEISDICKHINSKSKKQTVKSADYVPNIDVRGRSVTPADIDSTLPVIDPIVIPLEVNIAERYGLDLPVGLEMNAKIAEIKLLANGNIEFNDRDISTKIEKLCYEYEKDHRQEKDNPVFSNNLIDLNHKKQESSSDKIEGQYP